MKLYITVTPEIFGFLKRAIREYELEFSANFGDLLSNINFKNVVQETIKLPLDLKDQFSNSLDIHLQEFEHEYEQHIKDKVLDLVISIDSYRSEIQAVKENIVYVDFRNE